MQIGIVVRNADESAQHYAKLLGITDWHFNYVDSGTAVGQIVRADGKEVAVKAKIAWTNIGDIEIELIEPQDDTSVYAEYLRRHGPGVQHIMFGAKDYDRTSMKLSDHGMEKVLGGELQRTRFAMFDTREVCSGQ